MSEEREKKADVRSAEEPADVEAHKKAERMDETTGGDDDVEAHMKPGTRHANDDEGGDDVEAHAKPGRNL